MVTTYSGSAIPANAPGLNDGEVNSSDGSISAVSSDTELSVRTWTAMTTPAARKVSGTAHRGSSMVPTSHTTSTGATATGESPRPVTAFMHSGIRTPASIAWASGAGMEDATRPRAGQSPDSVSEAVGRGTRGAENRTTGG